MDRNPFVCPSKEPITDAQIERLEASLNRLWEDTQLVTAQGRIPIIEAGNLRYLVWELQQHRRNAR